jgi:hypothetical protein
VSDLYVAQGQRSSLMTGKETAYGTKATLTQTHNYEAFSMKPTDAPINLDGARGQIDTPYPAQGGRSVSGSVSLESTADTIGWWLAMGMGKQSTPSTTIVSTTVKTASLVGDSSITMTSGLNIFPGMILSVDTSTNLESLTVKSVAGNVVTFTSSATKAHAQGVAVTCTATSAYLSKFTLGTPLPSFTSEINTFGSSAGSSLECDDFLGCMVDSLAFALAKGQIKITPSLIAQTFANQGSPTTAAYSTKNPFIFEQQFSPPQWNATIIGTGTESSVISVSATLNNALQKDLFSLGNGNLCRKPQEGKRSVSGSIALDFATTTVRDAFQNAASGGQKAAVALTLPIAGTDVADATVGVPYALTIVLPKVYLSGWDGGWKSNGPLQQQVSFSAHPSGQGNNDSITVYYIGTGSSAY